MSTNRREWINKLVNLNNGVLLSNKKRNELLTQEKLDESYRHSTEWKKPDTKEHTYTLHDPIYMKF